MAFNKEFFGRIGESLSKTAKDLGVKASNVYEGQKIKSRISSEEKNIEKLKMDIGTLIYSRFENGEVYEGELGRLCQEITESLERITLLEKESASIRDMKICPCCRKEIPKAALFCPSCGAPCPVPEPEEDIPDDPTPLDPGDWEDLPATGLSWWPIPVLVLVGGALIFIGLKARKKTQK